MEQCRTPVRSPQSNGMAEAFVKTFKRDYVRINPKPDAETVMAQLPLWFEHYNNLHPHKALGYQSPREFLSRNAQSWKCPVFKGQLHIEAATPKTPIIPNLSNSASAVANKKGACCRSVSAFQGHSKLTNASKVKCWNLNSDRTRPFYRLISIEKR